MLGFINVYKPSLMTSNAVLTKIKKQFGIKKIGHMGTLDPLAEGVLPIAIGNATRMFDYFLNKQKTYIATFEFGYETDTLDSQGERVAETNVLPTKGDIISILPSFVGKQMQMPPKYSAKNVNGKRAYDLARAGIEFDLRPKEIEIFDIKLLENAENSFVFEITCSSGTYIRSICRDLGYRLNSLATMTKLVRIKSGKFTLENAFKLDDVLSENIEEKVIKIPHVFDFKEVNLDDVKATKLKNGMTISYVANETFVFVVNNQQLIGVGEIINNKLKLKTHF